MSEHYSLCEKIKLMGVRFKPCPFCGEPLDDMPILMILKEQHSEEYLFEKLRKEHIIASDNGYEVVCPSCGARGGHDCNPVRAINKWNTRRKKKQKDQYGFNAEFYGYPVTQYMLPITDGRHCCGKCPCRQNEKGGDIDD